MKKTTTAVVVGIYDEGVPHGAPAPALASAAAVLCCVVLCVAVGVLVCCGCCCCDAPGVTLLVAAQRHAVWCRLLLPGQTADLLLFCGCCLPCLPACPVCCAGDCNIVVENLGDYLKEQGI